MSHYFASLHRACLEIGGRAKAITVPLEAKQPDEPAICVDHRQPPLPGFPHPPARRIKRKVAVDDLTRQPSDVGCQRVVA